MTIQTFLFNLCFLNYLTELFVSSVFCLYIAIKLRDMKQGIRFYMIDGSTQDYDPLNKFEELDDKYIAEVFFIYEINKSEVVSYEYYPLCEKHGYENSEKYKCNECELEKN